MVSQEDTLLCSIQAEAFTRCAISSDFFIKEFLKGIVAKTMDDRTYFSEGKDVFAETDEINRRGKGTPDLSPEVMHWLGFIYRYWACEDGTPSIILCHIAPPSVLAKYYPSAHTADPSKAMEMIKSGLGIRPSPKLSFGQKSSLDEYFESLYSLSKYTFLVWQQTGKLPDFATFVWMSAFGVEIGLKAILFHYGEEDHKTHSLKSLYESCVAHGVSLLDKVECKDNVEMSACLEEVDLNFHHWRYYFEKRTGNQNRADYQTIPAFLCDLLEGIEELLGQGQ